MTAPVQQRAPGAPRRPVSRLPQIPGPLETLLAAWRVLRRMSTALWLLLAMATASVVATFVPQRPVVPDTVAAWLAGLEGPGERVSSALDALGLFDVFGSAWFLALTTLLFVSLTGCLVPRWRAFVRNARRPPPAGRNLERLTHHAVVRTGLAPAAALDAAAVLLRRRRFRVSSGPPGRAEQVAAERGHWREGGSLVFHTAFYLLLVGIVIGKAFGFTGQINLVEGSSFADTRIAYDLAEPGRWFDVADHRGFAVTLRDFDVDYRRDFSVADFTSRVAVRDPGGEVTTGDVRVNHPFAHDGMSLYQMRFGMAPRVVVRAGERVVFDESVMMADQGGSVWTGVAKVSVADPQIALDLVLLPDAAVSADGGPFSRSPEPRNPRLIGQLYVGDLGLERPVPASDFLRRPSARAGPPVVLAEGGSAAVAGGELTMAFPELREWSGFQVSHAPGRPVLLLAAVLILVGLVPSLYAYRRRVWVEARRDGASTRLMLAGVTLQRHQTFAEEFTALTSSLRRSLPAADRQER